MTDDTTYDIHAVLANYGWELPGERSGWVSVRCGEHEDSHASARINYDLGAVKCLGCGFGGDCIAVIRFKDGVSFREAKRIAEALTESGGRDIQQQRGRGGRVPYSPRSSGGSRSWVPPGRRAKR